MLICLKATFLIIIIFLAVTVLILIDILNLWTKSNNNLELPLQWLREKMTGNCSFITSEKLLQHGGNYRFPDSGIPKIVHYTYENDLLPEQYYNLVKNCININIADNVIFIMWTDKLAYNLLKNYYPQKLRLYNSYLLNEPEKLKKSDIIRNVIIHKFGGIYMDLDTRCQLSFSKAFELNAQLNRNLSSSCIISSDVDIKINLMYNMDKLAMNSFMACIPHHNFFTYIIDNMRINNENSTILHFTGPFYLTNLLTSFKGQLNRTAQNVIRRDLNNQSITNATEIAEIDSIGIPGNAMDKVTYGHWRVFSPLINLGLDGYCGAGRIKNQILKIKACKVLPNYKKQQQNDIDSAAIVHLFMHLGYTKHKNLIKKHIPMCGLKQKLYFISK